jgi:hypothetical protein
MSVEEFKSLDEVEQAQARVHAFMANKQLGAFFYKKHRLPRELMARHDIIDRAVRIAQLARFILGAAGESFMERKGGYHDLLTLLAESTGCEQVVISEALGNHLTGYSINLALGTIVPWDN